MGKLVKDDLIELIDTVTFLGTEKERTEGRRIWFGLTRAS